MHGTVSCSVTTLFLFCTFCLYCTRVVDSDPNWILRIQSGLWIRIRNPDTDLGGQK
jgi:hypothetical protein